MNIIMTGATGFVGRALALRLLRDRHRVVALVRSVARARGQLGAEVECVALDDDDATAAAVASADAVVNLAGEPIMDRRWTAARKQSLRDSRLALTQRLVAMILRRDRALEVLVSASAVGYYGDRGEQPLDETARAGDDFAAALCRDWEAAASLARPRASRVVLARLGIVLGGEGGALSAMSPLFKLGLGGRVGSGQQWVPWVHLEDAVEALAMAVTQPALDGPVNVVAPAPVRNHELAAELGRALRRPALVPAPALALRAVLGERAQMVLGGQRALPARLTELGFVFRHATLKDALAEATSARGPVELRSGAEPS